MTLTKLALFAAFLLCFKQVAAYEYLQAEEVNAEDEDTQHTPAFPHFFNNEDEFSEYGYGYFGYPPMPHPDFDSMSPPDYNGSSVRPSFMSMMSNMYPTMSTQSDAPMNGTMPYFPPMYMPPSFPPPMPRPIMTPEMFDGEMQRPVMPSDMADFELLD